MSAKTNATAAAALVSGLIDGGLAHVVVSPGSRNTPLTLALAHRDDLEVVSILDERAAGFFALGLARSSGRPVALCCTSGSAATHYLPAVVEADASGVPLILLTADRPAELHDCGAPQTMDQRRLFGTFVREARDLPAPASETECGHLVTVGAQAMARASRAPAGPVHLNCAFRKPLWAPGENAHESLGRAPRWIRGTEQLHEAALTALCGELSTARRGVIVCGPHGPDDPDFSQQIRSLAERLQWPVLASIGSGVRFFTDGPEQISAYDVFLRSAVSQTLEADCVLRFGQWPTSKPLGQWLARQSNTLLVSEDGRRHDPTHRAAQWIDATPMVLVSELLARLAPSALAGPWRGRWASLEAATRKIIEDHCQQWDWEGAIARRVVDSVPDGGVVHLANSMAIREVTAVCPPDGRRLRAYVNRGVNGIDGTLATVAGEAMGSGRPVTALVGDLAFLHDLGGLLVAAPHPVTFVVVDNGGGGIFGFLPIAQNRAHFETLFRTPQKADLAQLCAGANVRYRAMDDLSALPEVVAREHERPGASVIHITVDPTVNMGRHEALWAAVAQVVEVAG